jgi:F-type H+-transporting ATPase subunit epsilon
MTLHVEVVSPERILYTGDASMVIARTVSGGEIAFMTGHVPFIGALDIRPVRIKQNGNEQVIAVHGGFIEVSEDNVIVLSDVAELPEQIDVARAERAKEEAEQARREAAGDPAAAATATDALRRAELRLEVANVR